MNESKQDSGVAGGAPPRHEITPTKQALPHSRTGPQGPALSHVEVSRSAAGGPGPRYDVSLLSDHDLYLFNEGTHYRLWEKLGSHPRQVDGVPGCSFGVWAPNAEYVSVVGDFNDWNPDAHPLRVRARSGIWEGWLPGVREGTVYKYHIRSRINGYRVDKADPFARQHETPPATASVVRGSEVYRWSDDGWMAELERRNSLHAPVSIYECHLGSWMRVPEEGNRSLTYRELAPRLGEHLKRCGFTHVEFLPVMEHPFFGSWGYQTTGYFAPSSRFGTPDDFAFLVDSLHGQGIGVILDWVPSHFPGDEHGLVYFDGTHLFEHSDPRRGFHPDWNSYIFNYNRNEVRAFLVSSALFWLDQFHADGLRVDAVASMLYLDYSRRWNEWIPNQYGGRENLEAIDFLRQMNAAAERFYPGRPLIAEESTSWPGVSRPTQGGGLGFTMKWDMGWMHDTLDYLSRDPMYRANHHNQLTFRGMYAWSENWMLPLSHDEVVYGKGSLLGKMPGDEWQRFANLRLLLGYMWAQPGKKLLFMGSEWGQGREWNHDGQLDWGLLQQGTHRGVLDWVSDLNRLLHAEPALSVLDTDPAGWEWINADDRQNSAIAFLRLSGDPDQTVLVACNFTPTPRPNYRVGAPALGNWRVLANSDDSRYGGSGYADQRLIPAVPVPSHGRYQSLCLDLPPLGIVFLRREPAANEAEAVPLRQ